MIEDCSLCKGPRVDVLTWSLFLIPPEMPAYGLRMCLDCAESMLKWIESRENVNKGKTSTDLQPFSDITPQIKYWRERGKK